MEMGWSQGHTGYAEGEHRPTGISKAHKTRLGLERGLDSEAGSISECCQRTTIGPYLSVS